MSRALRSNGYKEAVKELREGVDAMITNSLRLEKELYAAQAEIADLQEKLRRTEEHLNAAQGLAAALMGEKK
jgi:predicted nuclease with TOPRIM domain